MIFVVLLLLTVEVLVSLPHRNLETQFQFKGKIRDVVISADSSDKVCQIFYTNYFEYIFRNDNQGMWKKLELSEVPVESFDAHYMRENKRRPEHRRSCTFSCRDLRTFEQLRQQRGYRQLRYKEGFQLTCARSMRSDVQRVTARFQWIDPEDLNRNGIRADFYLNTVPIVTPETVFEKFGKHRMDRKCFCVPDTSKESTSTDVQEVLAATYPAVKRARTSQDSPTIEAILQTTSAVDDYFSWDELIGNEPSSVAEDVVNVSPTDQRQMAQDEDSPTLAAFLSDGSIDVVFADMDAFLDSLPPAS
ncbi:hypothetical protein MRB53_040900 [Persea americana]|nr:hypothetical protein MRB53_040900 [Persea americana]